MSDSSGLSRPVQCSEGATQQPPLFQTGREVDGSSGSTLGSQNLQTDGGGAAQSGPAQNTPPRGIIGGGGDATGNAPLPDVITIQGPNGTITATGVAAAMTPGTNLQIGLENHMTVTEDRH